MDFDEEYERQNLHQPLLSANNDNDNSDNISTSPSNNNEDPQQEHHEEEPPLWESLTTAASPDQITAMLANFSTSYNVVSISQVLPIFHSPLFQLRPYYANDDDNDDAYNLTTDHQKEEQDSMCASAILAGMIVGQLVGGMLGDSIGRVRAMYCVILLQIGSSLLSAFIVPHFQTEEEEGRGEALSSDFFDKLAMCRFFLGVGCGGVYPLAAVLSAEQQESNSKSNQDDDSNDSNDSNDDNDDDNVRPSMRKLKLLSITFATQGIGFLMAPFVSYSLLQLMIHTQSAHDSQDLYYHHQLNYIWRIILAVGAFPGLFLIILRWKQTKTSSYGSGDDCIVEENGDDHDITSTSTVIPTSQEEESNHLGEEEQIGSTLEVENDNEQEEEEREVLLSTSTTGILGTSIKSKSSLWKSIKSEPNLQRKMLGTAGSWLLFDIVFYGNTLFQPIVLENAFGGGGGSDNNNPNILDEDKEFHLLLKTAQDSMILCLIALPGYLISVFMIGRLTLRYVQIQGFLFMSILYTFIGIFWDELKQKQWLLVILYGGTFFFANFGPNTTTFMLPSVTYSSPCSRSTLNGLSAACGKLGALLGATMFEPIASGLGGDSEVMILCAFVSFLAMCVTACCVK